MGYERTVYTTTEGEGSVELCVVVTSPATGGAPRSFVVAAATVDDTAGKEYVKYVLHIYTLILFPPQLLTLTMYHMLATWCSMLGMNVCVSLFLL